MPYTEALGAGAELTDTQEVPIWCGFLSPLTAAGGFNHEGLSVLRRQSSAR